MDEPDSVFNIDFLSVTLSNLVFILALTLSHGRTQKSSVLRKCHSCGYQVIEREGNDIRGHREPLGLFGLESRNLHMWQCAVSLIPALGSRGRN